jgi:hypothetical protein
VIINSFFKFFPMVPPMDFFFILWYLKGSKKNWPKCHSGQSVTGQNVTIQSDTGQTVSSQSVLGQKVTLSKVSFWPKCPDQSVSGQLWFSRKTICKPQLVMARGRYSIY